MNIVKLQEIIDGADMFLVEKISSLSKQELHEYLVKIEESIQNGETHVKDFSKSSSFRALSETRIVVETFIELRELKRNRNNVDENSKGIVIG